jgi:hypothetical protein
MTPVYHEPGSAAMRHVRALQTARIPFLPSGPWEWCCTFTFREIVQSEADDQRFCLFLSIVNRDLYGPHWHKKDAGMQGLQCLTWIDPGSRAYLAQSLIAGEG